jgi:fatty acid desaturase
VQTAVSAANEDLNLMIEDLNLRTIEDLNLMIEEDQERPGWNERIALLFLIMLLAPALWIWGWLHFLLTSFAFVFLFVTLKHNHITS